ncbi:MAG: ankyrin repeat domain-containing protein [Bacteroidota bacterium]
MNIKKLLLLLYPLLKALPSFAAVLSDSTTPVIHSAVLGYLDKKEHSIPTSTNDVSSTSSFDVNMDDIPDTDDYKTSHNIENVPRKEATEEEKEKFFNLIRVNDLQGVENMVKGSFSDIEVRDNTGNTPFLMACMYDREEIAKHLFSEGANIHVFNNDGWNALHFSCIHGKKDFSLWLSLEYVDLYARTKHGLTAFHLACVFAHQELAEWLLECGLSEKDVNQYDHNALDLVHTYGHHNKELLHSYLHSLGLQTMDEQREKERILSENPTLLNSPTPVQALLSLTFSNAFALYTLSLQQQATHLQCLLPLSDPNKSLDTNTLPSHNETNPQESFVLSLPSLDEAVIPSALPMQPLVNNTSTKDSQKPKPLVPIAEEKRSKKKYPCLYCPKGYSREDALDDHLPVHTDPLSLKCKTCNRSMGSLRSLKSHRCKKNQNEKTHKCMYCKKTYGRLRLYRSHLETHLNTKVLLCHVCYKPFTKKKKLKKHIDKHKERPFKCYKCLRCYRDKYQFKNHNEKVHSEKPKNYACQKCEKRFKSDHELKRHEGIHTGTATYICSTCKKNFTCLDSQRAHEKTIH